MYGYFGVVNEQYYRWNFSKDMISYDLPHPDEEDFCPPPFRNIPVAMDACFNCLDFPVFDRQTVTSESPVWWKD